MRPIISIVLPFYNRALYIKEAIMSVLEQSFGDFELLLINDGSTDDSLKIARSFDDKRIQIISYKKNMGVNYARNLAMDYVRGEYISVLDSDDQFYGNRLELQYRFMNKHEEVGVVGSWMILSSGEKIYSAIDPEVIKVGFFISNMMAHPTLLLRTEVVRKYDLKYRNYNYAGDYEMLTRAATFSKVAVLPEFLLKYRLHSGQLTQQHYDEMQKEADIVKLEYLKNILPNELTSQEQEIHLSLVNSKRISTISKKHYILWVEKLIQANERKGFFNRLYFKELMSRLLNEL